MIWHALAVFAAAGVVIILVLLIMLGRLLSKHLPPEADE